GELDEEISLHIEMRAEELQQDGMTRADARARARREFGSSLRVKEETRAAWQFRWLEETLSDLSYAARALRRNPGFAAAGIFSLALGIGANTTIFSLTMEFLFSEPSGRTPCPAFSPPTTARCSASGSRPTCISPRRERTTSWP